MKGRLGLTLLVCLLALSALAGTAHAEFGLSEFDVSFTDAEGHAETRAGSHPFEMTTSLHAVSFPEGETEATEEGLRDLLTAQVPGLVGNPTAVGRCTNADFVTTITVNVPGEGGLPMPDCPSSAAVGLAKAELSSQNFAGLLPAYGAIYNLVPPPGAPAKIGFWADTVPITITLGVSESAPYEIVGGPTGISQVLELISAQLTLWGVPASPAHDDLRGHCLNPGLGTSIGTCEAEGKEVPFLTLPRSCEGPLFTSYAVDSWSRPGALLENGEPDLTDPAWVKGSSSTPLEVGSCDDLGFEPEASVRPTTEAAQSAAGLDIEIDVDDQGLSEPEGIAQADIRSTRFALPEGLTANPSAAEGLGVCTQAQYEAESRAHRGCPEDAKIGSLEVETPILEDRVLSGSVFLAAPHQNPFGTLLAAYLVVRDPELGIFVKLPSKVETDEKTGRLTASVADMPPFPLSRVAVHLRSGPRAPFVTPTACGSYHTVAALTPSNAAAAKLGEPGFQIASGPGGGSCPGGSNPFAPAFEAGSQSNAAGTYSPFSMRITRSDGEAEITRISAKLPPGVVAKIAGVPSCPDAAIAAAASRGGGQELASPSCPAASRIGSVTAGAGVGSALTFAHGSLYLAGPYGGDPLSVVAVVPAVAGPFDLGTVVTREALTLDPRTGEAEVDGAASDPIPRILDGIPLLLRDLRINVDRPNFTVNPTSCEDLTTRAKIGGVSPLGGGETLAQPASRFQAAGCASLGFKPQLTLQLKGARKQLKRSGNPQLIATLRPKPGDANLATTSVLLPHSLFIDNAHINNPCTRVQFAAGACPPKSVLGTAQAFTPLLDAPLEGPVYFRSNGGERKLPDVVLDLRGLFHIEQVGFVDSRHGRVRTRFQSVPDAAISKVVLRFFGGKRGLLENSADLCQHKQRAHIDLVAHNGRRVAGNQVIHTQCKAKRKTGSGHGKGR